MLLTFGRKLSGLGSVALVVAILGLVACSGPERVPEDGASAAPEAPMGGLERSDGTDAAEIPVLGEQVLLVAPEIPSVDEITGELPDVVAMVGDVAITREVYQKEVETKQKQLAAELNVLQQTTGREFQIPGLSADAQQEALNTVVNRALIKMLAEEAGVEVDEAVVETRIQEGKANLSDEQSYQDYLHWYGITEDDLRQQIRDQLLTEAYLRANIPECVITEEEIRERYEELREAGQMDGPEDVDFWHVLILVPPGSPPALWDEANTLLQEARQRIEEGEDFGEVAMEVSHDPSAKRTEGLYTNIERGMMVQEVEDAIFSLPIGQLSGPVKTSYGLHIIRVKDRRAEGTRPLEQVSERIEESLTQNCQLRYAAEFLQQKREEVGVEVLYTVPGASEAVEMAPQLADVELP